MQYDFPRCRTLSLLTPLTLHSPEVLPPLFSTKLVALLLLLLSTLSTLSLALAPVRPSVVSQSSVQTERSGAAAAAMVVILIFSGRPLTRPPGQLYPLPHLNNPYVLNQAQRVLQ